MKPCEKLVAAIAKLEQERLEAHPGTWKHEPWPGDDSGLEAILDRDDSLFIQTGRHPRFAEDAELIVTLHRTIDAQLSILREAHFRVAARTSNAGFAKLYGAVPRELESALALADAILGSES